MGLRKSIGGWVVTKAPSGQLENFHWLGWTAVAAALASVWLGSGVRVHDALAPSQRPLPFGFVHLAFDRDLKFDYHNRTSVL